MDRRVLDRPRGWDRTIPASVTFAPIARNRASLRSFDIPLWVFATT
jgi:hypothetical protein